MMSAKVVLYHRNESKALMTILRNGYREEECLKARICVESLLESSYQFLLIINLLSLIGVLKRKSVFLFSFLTHFPSSLTQQIHSPPLPYWSLVISCDLCRIFDYSQSSGEVSWHSSVKLCVIIGDNVPRMFAMLRLRRVLPWLLCIITVRHLPVNCV